MELIETSFDGLFIIELKTFEDDRGCLIETYNEGSLSKLSFKNILELEVRSRGNVLRGMHYQIEPYAQAKIVRVLEGRVLDVVVDLRSGSTTYGENFSIVLDGDSQKQLYIPKGFAHGYRVLSNSVRMNYRMDNVFCKNSARGIIYNDKVLDIDWDLDEDPILSKKDKNLPPLGSTAL